MADYTVQQLADRANVTTARIRQLCKSGEIAAVKHGRDWLIAEREGDRWAKQYLARKAK